MKSLNEIKNVVRKYMHVLRGRYRVKDIGVFGSCVRGEYGSGSDVDFLVNFGEGADLFDLMGLSLFLEEKLGGRVDVVSKRALRRELRKDILREVVPV